MDLGDQAYGAYCAQTGGRSLISGDLLPKWGALKPEIRMAWTRAAERVATLVREQERRRSPIQPLSIEVLRAAERAGGRADAREAVERTFPFPTDEAVASCICESQFEESWADLPRDGVERALYLQVARDVKRLFVPGPPNPPRGVRPEVA